MIQITKEFSKQLKREQERQDRIEKCLSYLQIVTHDSMTPSGYATFAVVNSTSVDGRRYIVDLDESGDIPTPTHCNCDATVENCIHRQAVTIYYERIAAIFAHDEQEEVAEPVVEETVSLEQAMQEAQDEMVQIIEEAATAGDQSYTQVVSDVYEMAGSTKKVTGAKCVTEWVFSLACPHMVPAGKEHEECGACLDKLYG